MKNILSVIILLVLLIVIFSSCHKEDAINDYLPLKVGAKYRYKYLAGYSFISEGWRNEGECTWSFTSKSVHPSVVYQVEQSLNGYSFHYPYRDSTKIENQISTLSFEVLNDGKVTFHFSMPYWGASKVTFERFIQSDKMDTCFTFDRLINSGCLRKNIGISNFNDCNCGNHSYYVSYSLIEGPTY
jgi:hypothetical protein